MKNLKFGLLLILAFGITFCTNGQMRRTVYGNNKIEKELRDAGQFSALRVSSGIDVYLSQGERESIEVEADENLHEYILTENRNGVLHVYSEVNIREADVSASSAGDINYRGNPKYIDAHSSSAGSVNRK